jgi:polysaccharide biosynthesis/export protein
MKLHRKITFGLLPILLTVCCLFSSCLSQKKVMLLQQKSSKDVLNTFSNKKKAAYQIQSGDQLYIRIYSLDPKTSKFFQTDLPALMNPTYLYLNSFTVDDEGYINFSFIDKLLVRGMTLDEVKKVIQKALNDYFKETTVMVKLVNFQVSVLGEVKSPGNFTIDKEQVNILQAVALAGGFQEFGNVRKVTLIRQNVKGSEIIKMDLSDKKVLESDNFYLMPNDVIYVEPMKTKSYVLSKFPYEWLFSAGSLTLSVLIYLKLK